MNLIKGFISKFRNKNDMPSWYYERVLICNECSKNSKNNTKISLKDKIRISHNIGKDACLICSCGINDLASDPTVKCSHKSPKWDWIQVPQFDTKFNLKNYSPSKGNLIRDDKYYIYDFGKILYNTDAIALLLFVSEKELDDFKILASCGCTKPRFLRHEKGYLISVSYNTNNTGDFEKQISIIYLNKNNKKEYLTFWIKGCVENQQKKRVGYSIAELFYKRHNYK